MEECKIVIFSHKRWDRITTKFIVDDPIVYVPESQGDQYRDYNQDCEIVTHSDDIVGLHAKRQEGIKYFKNVFMMDDDQHNFHEVTTAPGEPNKKLPPERTRQVVNFLYELSLQLKVCLFGFGNCVRPVYYDEFQPFRLSGTMTGGAYGANELFNLNYNPNMKVAEDHWISMLNAYYNRRCLIDTRFHIQQSNTFVNAGGLSEIRNEEVEKSASIEMKRSFGDAVTVKKRSGELRNKNRWSRSLSLPF
jgi:hypothetical protein